MKYKALGNSGLITSNLTLGTMIFGEKSSRSTPEKEAIAMVDHYIAVGGNHLDTANAYSRGISEEIVGKAIAGKRENLIIATKVRFPMGDDPNQQGLSRWHMMQSVEASLQRMKIDTIDLLYLHCWDPITPIEETVRALDDLVTSGKVRYVGVSNFKAWQVMKAQGLAAHLDRSRFIAGQYQYSLVKRDIEYEFFDLFEDQGLGLMPWGPLGGGFLTGKYSRDQNKTGRISSMPSHAEEAWERRNTEQNWAILEVVKEIADRHQATPTQVSLAWMLSKELVSSVIIGPRTLEQLKDNLAANNLQLSADEIQQLDHVSSLPEMYPYRMIEAYGQRELS